MAKIKSKTQHSRGNELLENPEALAEKLSKTEEFLEKNRKYVLGVGGALVLILAGFFGYRYYQNNQNEAAHQEMFQAVYYFEADSLQLALEGDGNNLGFLELIDEYPITEAANLSHYYAGVSLLRLERFEEAIEHLKDFSSDDYMVQAKAYALTGDAYLELQETETAAEWYDKAAGYKPNEYFTPHYLMQAALAYELAGNLDEAIQRYQQIVDEYNEAAEIQAAEKSLSRLKGLAN
jgi:tetratricopeptide (TPR) repeat protein